jgi:hypothetical protein
MRVEDLNRQVIFSSTQYMKSSGQSIPKDIGGATKITAYFYPSMVFPHKVEVLSMTLLYKNDDTEKKIRVTVNQKKNTKNVLVQLGEGYVLTHAPNEVTTTLKFQVPLVLDPLQTFYFNSEEGVLEDSLLIISFRNHGLH